MAMTVFADAAVLAIVGGERREGCLVGEGAFRLIPSLAFCPDGRSQRHDFARERAQALDVWAAHILGIEVSNVVPLRGISQ